MKFDYNSYIANKILELKAAAGLTGIDFEVDDEQSFIKKKDLEPNTIYVLTKASQNTISIGVDTQPVQVLVLSENNSLDAAKAFFTKFAESYNFRTHTEIHDGVSLFIKEQYSAPVVMSNFNAVAYGYRSVLYMAVTFYVMEGVADLKSLRIDDRDYTALSFDLSYTMNGSPQQLGGDRFIARNVKSISSLALTITLPALTNNLTNKIFGILSETDTTTTDPNDVHSFGGNENFYISFTLGSFTFTARPYKLVSFSLGAAIDDVPAMRVGFSL